MNLCSYLGKPATPELHRLLGDLRGFLFRKAEAAAATPFDLLQQEKSSFYFA